MAKEKSDGGTPAQQYKGSELILAASGTHKDVLTVLLKPTELYTAEQVASMEAKFLIKEVKTHEW